MELTKKNIARKTAPLFLFIAILLFGASAYGAPKLTVIPEEYKFGEITEGESIAYKFIVENRGDSDLIINNVKPG